MWASKVLVLMPRSKFDNPGNAVYCKQTLQLSCHISVFNIMVKQAYLQLWRSVTPKNYWLLLKTHVWQYMK